MLNDSSVVYLKPDVRIEPLVARWYAWPHLLSPASLALNLEYRYMPLLQSYLDNPDLHHAAAQESSLFCGPFMNINPQRSDEVEQLAVETRRSAAHALVLARAIRKLEREILLFADGDCLDHHYATLPDCLRGRIELGYDCHGRPNFRLFEELLYLDRLVAPLQQISLAQVRDDRRDFFLNTPRLASPQRLDLNISFADPAIDELADLRTRGRALGEIKVRGNLDQRARAQFDAFLTEQVPVRCEPQFDGYGLRIRYLGHACILVQSASTTILFDPVVPWERDDDQAQFVFDDLPDWIDYVILTHNHQDHVSIETLLQLRSRIGEVIVPRPNSLSTADPSLKLMLEHLGFQAVREVGPLTSITLADGHILTIPFLGEHADLDIQAKHGVFLELRGKRLLFLADSKCVDRQLYSNLTGQIGNVDILFIGMECDGAPLTWLYGPHLSEPPSRRHDNARRLSGSNCERAWAVVEEIGCKQIYVYAMGQENWLRYLLGLSYNTDSPQIFESNKFIEKSIQHSIPAERLYGCQQFYLS
jgi:L-ascorbate metabolism protein UlaG (beta-lactamase superfamily)